MLLNKKVYICRNKNIKIMKIVKYKCNLCQEEKDRTEITAFYFKSSIIPQRYVLDESKIDECDKHICEKCIQVIISNTI